MEHKDQDVSEFIDLCNLYKQTFGSLAGQKVLAHLEGLSFVNDTTFSETALTMAFREGQRSNILHIKNMVNMDVDALRKLNPPQNEDKEE